MKEIKKLGELLNELKNQKLYLFPKRGKGIDCTIEHGVYLIYDYKQQTLLYVGRSITGKEGLRQRIRNHLNGSSSFHDNYLNVEGINLHNGYYYKSIVVKDPRTRALLEALAIGTLCPVYVGTGKRKQ